ncbi:hypothetical protein KOW79_016879 [Hemibagrus wyckioides]|uniref:MAM and LDL-receptor class A domain-containing protein 1-like n=1 Tax=Hemibagrus wyckioides TaxID=337641 RepID=A0A9D3NAG4_9TELE|nr:hypothetical protein KOW79_016879 [Hemibagrus wyckioides]
MQVNGIWKKLPLSLDEGKIKISAYGPDVVLQTNFNLSVSFAKTGALEVSVPIQYSNKLCGMCGNFNNLMDDDKNMPDRSLVKDTQILGQKWKSASFYCQDPIVPSMCSESEKLEYADKLYCGVLLSQNGPFAKCSSSLDTSSLFRNCISEMCTTKGDHEAFCDVLQAVEMSCSEVGISVTGWRNATHCSLACGSNSHFNACSSDCPATCSGLDAAEDCGRCQERCDCDDGLLLSGDRCVPMEDCGCWVDGQHYQKGESFMDDNCESLCMCAGQGNIQCSAVSCLTHEVCKVENGVIGCFPSSPVTCSVYGDPHYITFDGKAYSFQGTCNYTIAKACDAGAVQFTLTARNEELRNYTSSSLNSVALDVDGFHLAIRQNKLVYVNGSQITLPFSHSTSVSVSQTGPYVKVETNFGLRFLFNGNDRLFVQVDERHKGRMCGLCGTYSGSQFDDFLTPGGSVVPYPHVFANSWNTHDKEWPCINGSENKPKCSPELENKGFQECSKLFGEDFKACHWFVPPQIFVNSCVHDFCTSGGDQTQLCTSLENYVAACEVSEVFLGDWWKGTVCDVPTTLPTVKPSTPTPSQPTTIISSASCSWSCNFDQDECGWEQLIQDSFDWTRMSGSTPSDFTGPSSDHTTGSGFYMYIEGDGVYHGDSARMLSPKCNTLGTQCMTFWYHMYGGEFMMLSVYLLEENRATKIWSIANNQGNQWHLSQIEINPIGPFRIIVEGIRGLNAQSDVAWDDVTIVHGKCRFSMRPEPEVPSPTMSITTSVCGMDCNFENSLCTWTQMLTDVFDWTRHNGSTPTPKTGPLSDHTTGDGYYLYIEGDSAAHGDTARLLSEECSDVQPQCLQFWYHMYGSSWTMGLSVYLLHGNVAQEVWRKQEDQGNVWHQALVDITPHGKFRILFEGRRGHSDRSDVALDDVSLQRGPCADPNGSSVSKLSPIISTVSSTSTPPEPPIKNTIVVPVHRNDPAPVKSKLSTICRMNCNFDYNLCTWTQLLTDVFDWTRQQGSTPTSLTGPSSDHTTGTGYYLYIEGDSATHGDTARLLSEECSDVQPQCLQFWYHMYGSSWTMGLSVYLLHGNVAQEVWRRRENQGNTWHQALVDITPHSTFRILFEGRRGDNARSDVALDDVFIHPGPCADLINHQTASPAPEKPTLIPKVTSATTKSAFSPVCAFDCNYDNNLCTWSQLATDVFDWTRHSGPTSTALTGPSSDHTTGTGYYLYIEGDTATHGDTARLLSEECSDVQPQCLQFWYHMYGSSWTMGLSVYLLHGNVAQEVWRKRENQGNTWHQALVDITPHSTFRILFEGRRGDNARSDVALDDVFIHTGPCADLINHQTASPAPEKPTLIPTVTSATTKSAFSPVCAFDCNFDNNLCTWSQLATDVFDWTRHSGPTSTALTGPSSDHTTGTGYYLYIEGDSAAHGDTARLLSEECSDVQPQCLQFWYHMYGSSWTMGLSVYLLHGNVAQEVWRRRENQGNTWHQAQVDITPHSTFRILFEGRRGDNARSDVALDDVFIHTGPCADLIHHQTASPAPEKPTLIPKVTSATTKSAFSPVCEFDCNFDNNLCTWSQLATDVFDWKRHSGPTSTALTGPSSDHTTGTGYYLYIEGDSATHGDTARLLSEECSDVQPQCLQFWYHMYGSSWTMGLSVYLLHGNVAQEVWRKRENQGNTWHQAQVDITPHGTFRILFEGRRGDNARSDVALDDVFIHTGPCADLINHQTASPAPEKPTLIPTVTSATTKSAFSPVCAFDCNFDNNLCTWSQLATDVFDWTRHSGPTSTALTGPSSDHTTGTGYYLYIEGDSATHGDTARLLSEECSDVQPQCLQFWYHMYGSSWTMGLSVYLLHGNVAQEVWRKRENQGNTWHQAQVDITPHSTFRILFEGRRGDNARSDVALDDVFIHTGPCADLINHQTASPAPEKPTLIPTVTSATTKSAFSPVCAFDCNFDNNLCTWSQLATDVFDWTRHSGPTSTALTGPSSDHTTGTGYYLYIEGDSAAHGDTARLLSEECSDVQPQCLQFWYHMYGSSWTMGLSVYLLHGNVAQEVWRKKENQGNTWHQAQVDITPHGKFRILFEGRRGDNARSDVALDDVFIHRGPCADLINHQTASPAPEKPTLIPTVTSATTKSAFSPVCAFDCNFDNNLCTWSQLATDVFDWTRHSGPTSTALTGPSSDHTTGTGYYLYIEGDSATHGDTARLLSEECSDVQPQCLQFWYHMYGSSWTMGLSVYLLHGNVAQEVWRKRENQGNTWHQALVDITPHSTFRILFEGRRGDNARSDVALDDVFIHTGPCADLINHQTASPAPEKPTLIPTVTSATTKSAFSPVCAFDCNFDNNLCTWSQLATDVFDWTRHSGPTSTALTGPSSDHTTGTGYYLYIEGDSAAHGDTARLLSEECSDVQPQCLQFWYHMYGSSWTMGLSVYLLHGNEAQEVWRKREDQGNVWHQALVDITPHGKFRLLFEGRRGHNARDQEHQASAGCSEPTALCCPGTNSLCHRGCFCDEACLQFRDCCPDYSQTCITLSRQVTTTTTTTMASTSNTSKSTFSTKPTTSVTITTDKAQNISNYETSLFEDTSTTITVSNPGLSTTPEHQTDFTSSLNPENTYQTSYQTTTSSTTTTGGKETPGNTFTPLDGSSTQTKESRPHSPETSLFEDTATTITGSNSHLSTTPELQTTQSITPDFTSSLNPENTYPTSYQTPTSSTSSTREKETSLFEDTATTITGSNSHLSTTPEHQTTQSLTPAFTSSLNPENTYQTSYQTPTSSTSTIRRKETSLFEDTATTTTDSNSGLSTTTEHQTTQSLTPDFTSSLNPENTYQTSYQTTTSSTTTTGGKDDDDVFFLLSLTETSLFEDTSTTITDSNSGLSTTPEHQNTQSLTPDFTSSLNPENTYQTSYQTTTSSTTTTGGKDDDDDDVFFLLSLTETSLFEDTSTTITDSNSGLSTTTEHQTAQSLTSDFTSSLNPENTYQTSYQTTTSSTTTTGGKETSLFEDIATTITDSNSHLSTTPELQTTQSITPDFTSPINPENTYPTSYQTPTSSTSSTRERETSLFEDTATTITDSNSHLSTTPELQTTQSITPDFTSSLNPENTYQTSYQTPTSSTSTIRRKETSLFEDTSTTITGFNLDQSTTPEHQTTHLFEDTATTITGSNLHLPTTPEHQTTQSITPDFTSSLSSENTYPTSYQTPASSTSSTRRKETPGNTFTPLDGSSTQTEESNPHSQGKTDI